MGLGVFPRGPFQQRDTFLRKFVQRHDLQVSAPGLPAGSGGIDANLRKVVWQELMQFDQQHATRLAEGRVVRSGWIAKVRARAKVAMFIGKNAVQHQNFFPQRVSMPRKRSARIIANNTRGVTSFSFFARQRLSPDA
jgi:hypothetical protein